MDDSLLHSAAWTRAVLQVRDAVRLPEGGEEDLDRWLKDHRDPTRTAVFRAYRDLAEAEGLPLRYLNYFLACVLSHHGGGTLAHSLPDRMMFAVSPPMMATVRGDRWAADSYYRLEYWPDRQKPAGYHWEPLAPPRAFSIAWPNASYVGIYRGAAEAITALVKDQLEEHLNWIMVTGWAFGPLDDPDAWRDGFRWVARPDSPLAGRAVRDVLGLPETWGTLATVVPVPWLVLPGGPSGSADQVGLAFRGGGRLDRWTAPRVERDVTIDKADARLADRWEAVLHLLRGNPRLSRRQGGRKRLPAPPPGGSALTRGRELLRLRLADQPDALSAQEIRRVVHSVTRQVHREQTAQGLAGPSGLRGKWWADTVAAWKTDRPRKR